MGTDRTVEVQGHSFSLDQHPEGRGVGDARSRLSVDERKRKRDGPFTGRFWTEKTGRRPVERRVRTRFGGHL